MRSLVLLCALVMVVISVCKPSTRLAELPRAAPSTQVASESEFTIENEGLGASKAPLLSWLTLGAALVGAVASPAPYEANATVALRIVERTTELQASAARVADHRRPVH